MSLLVIFYENNVFLLRTFRAYLLITANVLTPSSCMVEKMKSLFRVLADSTLGQVQHLEEMNW